MNPPPGTSRNYTGVAHAYHGMFEDAHLVDLSVGIEDGAASEPDPADETAETDDAAAPDVGGETEAVSAPADAGDEEAAETDADEGSADVDLEDAVMDAMESVGDGDGADREALVAAVVDEHGVDPEAVEDAIQDALMSGRCYEPADGTLKAI